MESMTNLFEFMGSSLAGGVTGLIGVALSFVGDHLRAKRDDTQRVALLAQAETEARSLTESAAAADDASTLAGSLAADVARYTPTGSAALAFVDVVRGLTRPVITLFLCVAISVFYVMTEHAALRLEILQTALYVTTSSVLWWFGTRPLRRS